MNADLRSELDAEIYDYEIYDILKCEILSLKITSFDVKILQNILYLM